jgi:hypothetical protein
MKHHLVQGTNKEGIEETSMEDSQADNSANELEVVEMLWVDARVRVDLEGVVVVCGVLEQAIEGVEHLMREKEEKLSGETTVIQTILAIEFNHQPLLQVISRLTHNLGV